MRLVLALCTLSLFAEDAPRKDPPKPPPEVSSELQGEFWQMMYDNEQAQAQAKAAVDALQQVNLKIIQVCGADFLPSILGEANSKTKKIVCQAKPKADPPPKAAH